MMNSKGAGLVAVVTGAGRPSGIGFEVCRQLATQGMRVVLTARDGDAARQRAEELRSEGLEAFANTRRDRARKRRCGRRGGRKRLRPARRVDQQRRRDDDLRGVAFDMRSRSHGKGAGRNAARGVAGYSGVGAVAEAWDSRPSGQRVQRRGFARRCRVWPHHEQFDGSILRGRQGRAKRTNRLCSQMSCARTASWSTRCVRGSPRRFQVHSKWVHAQYAKALRASCGALCSRTAVRAEASFAMANRSRGDGDSRIEEFQPRDWRAWRRWLAGHHDRLGSVWLVFTKKPAEHATRAAQTPWRGVVLRLGGSRPRKLDDVRYAQLYSSRNPNSPWPKIN